jgi:hypothetical protein
MGIKSLVKKRALVQVQKTFCVTYQAIGSGFDRLQADPLQ